MFKNKIILVTGGTGSWGHELIRQLLEKEPKEIRIFSRGELAQVKMSRNFNNSILRFIIGDVRDYSALLSATQNVDYVFHLAALKHVNVCEEQPMEAIKTNIAGTQNLISVCIQNKVKKVIDVSTDKAVEALNLYGMSKAVAERLIVQANQLSNDTKFVCIRAGNVLGSNGSVVPFFINQIQTAHKITITDKRMTRFFLTIPDAIHLLFEAAEHSYGGEVFVTKMPSYYINDIANVLRDYYATGNVPIIETGIRPGEKLHEVLITESEASHTFQYGTNYYVILPTIKINGLQDYYNAQRLTPVDFERYTSKDFVLNSSECIPLLQKGNFL